MIIYLAGNIYSHHYTYDDSIDTSYETSYEYNFAQGSTSLELSMGHYNQACTT